MLLVVIMQLPSSPRARKSLCLLEEQKNNIFVFVAAGGQLLWYRTTAIMALIKCITYLLNGWKIRIMADHLRLFHQPLSLIDHGLSSTPAYLMDWHWNQLFLKVLGNLAEPEGDEDPGEHEMNRRKRNKDPRWSQKYCMEQAEGDGLGFWTEPGSQYPG